jgi:hypothetical protein
MAGVSHAMSPASVFASTARRSARRLTAAAHLAHRPSAGAAYATRAAGIHPSVCAARALASSAGPGRARAFPRGLHVSRVRAVADPAVPEPPSKAEPPAAAAAADDDAAPRAGVVHSVEGSLAILEGIGGDVKPGTLLDVGGAGATAVLLAHREPKTFRAGVLWRGWRDEGRAASRRRGVFERQTRRRRACPQRELFPHAPRARRDRPTNRAARRAAGRRLGSRRGRTDWAVSRRGEKERRERRVA